ncbi:MAG: NAD-dependent epimerase/dehydratase family protein [Alphaproteobacteria bacterium]|nr:NAD-dependent epimerase/dehydratase family protein [Alphaproteobacteria bacterium]
MVKHENRAPKAPSRVVVLGAGGFVGGAAADRLASDNVEVARLGRKTVDLLTDGASDILAAQLDSQDALLVVSAHAPCKNTTMLADNIRMMDSVCRGLEKSPVSHVVYISSDAVYADDPNPLIETSRVGPDSLHGMMHAARELMLKSIVGETPYAVLRPSLLYGVADPHNGYGPNQFRRRAAAGEDIVLFGEGEERRDHVLIDDVAEIIRLVLFHRSRGALNIATGVVASFREVAEMVAGHFNPLPKIAGRPRQGPMPHSGYRPFNIDACRSAFPAFRYTSLEDGLAKTHAETS